MNEIRSSKKEKEHSTFMSDEMLNKQKAPRARRERRKGAIHHRANKVSLEMNGAKEPEKDSLPS